MKYIKTNTLGRNCYSHNIETGEARIIENQNRLEHKFIVVSCNDKFKGLDISKCVLFTTHTLARAKGYIKRSVIGKEAGTLQAITINM